MNKTEYAAFQADRERAESARIAGSIMGGHSIRECLNKGLDGYWRASPYVKEWPRGTYRPILRYRYETT